MKRLLVSAAVAAIVLGAGLSQGMFMNNSVKVPVDRVVTNVQAWIKDKPTDAQAYYVLGRIHAMAWAYGPELTLNRGFAPGNANGRGAAGAGRGDNGDADPFNGQLPGFVPYDSVEVRTDAQKKDVSADDATHLSESIKNYTKATELDPKSAIYELGLAWILQETGKVSMNLPDGFAGTSAKVTDDEKAAYAAAISKLGDSDVKTRDDATALLLKAMPKPLAQLKGTRNDNAEAMARMQNIIKGFWELQALEHYRKAYQINLKQDLGRGGAGPAADGQISAEAGDQILVLLKSHPEAAKENEASEITDNLNKMFGGPRIMTPVIFAMPGQRANSVGDLVDSSKRVGFDLAGDGVPRAWPWLKNGTALLVWDPAHTGKITSGKQLFGSRTWWICFRNGYEALSVLDDNRDGRLTGAELQGIAVWIDKNGDGISQPGEVITLAQAGIVSIEVHASADADGTLESSAGIGFADGRVVKSFDWVTPPAAVESKSPPAIQ